jgi:hypothetical protein
LRVINGGKSVRRTADVNWEDPPLTAKQLAWFSEVKTTRQVASYFRVHKIKHMSSVLVWYEDRGILACRRLNVKADGHDNSSTDAWGWHLTDAARHVIESTR